MSSKIQELTQLILALKKILPQADKSFTADPFTCLRVHVLEYILTHERTDMKDVADFLAITPPSATSLINRLARAGVISRVRDKSDRRKVLLKITTKGKTMLTKGKMHIEQHMGQMFSVLKNDELDQFIRLMKKLVEVHQKNV